MSYHLFLDDIRDPSWVHWMRLPRPPGEEWVIVRSHEEFVGAIQERGLPDFISFDHDLDQEGQIEYELTGMDCAKWLVEFCLDADLAVPEFSVHSQNPPGRDNIQGLLSSLRNHQQQQRRKDMSP
jgi:hypothetical protein